MKRVWLATIATMVAGVLAMGCEDVNKPPTPDDPPQVNTGTKFSVKPIDPTLGQPRGLHSSDVYDIMVDSNSDIWISTALGVTRFNSAGQWEGSWDQNVGLANPKCRGLHEFNGKVWVSTWGGGISVYNMALDSWSILNTDSGLTDNLVADITSYNNQLFVATNNGVAIYDDNSPLPVQQRWTRFGTAQGLLDVLTSRVVVHDSPRGEERWYSPRIEFIVPSAQQTQHGITIHRPGSGVTTYNPVQTGLTEPHVTDMVYDATNDLMWFAMGSTGVLSFDPDDNIWTQYTRLNGLPSDITYAVAFVGDVLWVGTQNGVARRLGNGSFIGYNRGGGLRADRVRTLFVVPGTTDRLFAGYIDGGAEIILPGTATQ